VGCRVLLLPYSDDIDELSVEPIFSDLSFVVVASALCSRLQLTAIPSRWALDLQTVEQAGSSDDPQILALSNRLVVRATSYPVQARV